MGELDDKENMINSIYIHNQRRDVIRLEKDIEKLWSGKSDS